MICDKCGLEMNEDTSIKGKMNKDIAVYKCSCGNRVSQGTTFLNRKKAVNEKKLKAKGDDCYGNNRI